MNATKVPNLSRWAEMRAWYPNAPIPKMVKDPDTGRIIVNPMKLFVKPFTLSIPDGEIALAAGALSDVLPMTIDGKGHFEIFGASAYSSDPAGFMVTLYDGNKRMPLQNRELHVDTIASRAGATLEYETLTQNAGRFYRWPQSYWMNCRESSALFATLRNLGTSTNTCKFCLHGLRWYYVEAPTRIADLMQKVYLGSRRTAPFFFTTDRNVELAGSGTASRLIRLGDTSWTEMLKISGRSTGRYTIQLFEAATDKRLMDQPLQDRLVVGQGEFPFLAWESWMFEPYFDIRADFVDLSESTNDIYLTLGCRKIWPDDRETWYSKLSQSVGRT